MRRLLTDRDLDWRTRLVHLQGWRGAEAVQAKEAWWLLAPAPLLCAVGAVAGGLLGSSTLLLLLAVSAAIGAIAPHHPIEVVANLHARRRGRVPKPPSPAGRRTGCAMGSVVLPVAAVLMAAGHTAAGAAVAIGFGGVAAFVGLTGICVPSIILTTWRGTEACTATDPITRRSHTV